MRERFRVVATVAREPNLLRIQLAFLGFNMTEYACWIAILVYAFDRRGPAGAGIAALVQLVPSGIVAPFGAFASDRFRRERVLLLGYVGQALALGATAAALAAAAPLAVVYALAAVAASSQTFTRPTQAALLPAATRTPEELTAANAVAGLAENLGIFVGPFVAGLILARADPAVVFGVFAVVTAVGAILVAGVRLAGASTEPVDRMTARDVVTESLEGFRTLRRDPSARLLVAVPCALSVVIGALDVLFVAVAIDLLQKGQGWAGFLSAAFGAGGIVAAAFTVSMVGRRRLTVPLVEGAVLFGAPVAVAGAAATPITAPVLFAATGSGRAIASVAANTLLQRAAPEEVLARVFGVLEGLTMFALAIGSVSASSLTQAFGVRAALVVVGAFVPALVVLLRGPLLSLDEAAKAPDPEALELLRRLSVFAPLPPPAMERVMANLTRLDVPAGTVLIREGDEGDRCYVLVEGTVSVSRAGRHIADRHAGEMLGEIALMRSIPRTATVVATTPLRLLSLERAPFLEAVTGHPQSRIHAEALVERHLEGR